MVRLLLVDNYDSFTWNLVHGFEVLSAQVEVVANDAASAEELLAREPDAVVISPGPGSPQDAGVCVDLVLRAAGRVPLLGVCLGHQALAVAFGGRVHGARRLMHGKTSAVRHDGRGLFREMPSPFEAMRYHSLIVDPDRIGRGLRVAASAAADEIMALRHETLPLYGVQFHPESVATPDGTRLLANFLAEVERCRPSWRAA